MHGPNQRAKGLSLARSFFIGPGPETRHAPFTRWPHKNGDRQRRVAEKIRVFDHREKWGAYHLKLDASALFPVGGY